MLQDRLTERKDKIYNQCRDEIYDDARNQIELERRLVPAATLVKEMDQTIEAEKIEDLLNDEEIRREISKRISIIEFQRLEQDLAEALQTVDHLNEEQASDTVFPESGDLSGPETDAKS